MITLESKGDFKYTEEFLKNVSQLRNGRLESLCREYGEEGVAALEEATPKDTGRTAYSWTYDVHISDGSVEIVWSNNNTVRNGGLNVAVLIQYGHGTGTGGYVQGRDYINPAMRPLFDAIADELWKEITG